MLNHFTNVLIKRMLYRLILIKESQQIQK